MKELMLLHGWGVRPAVFEELCAALADRYRVHAPALAGYDCAPSCSPYSLERLADELAERAPARCAVAGWSLGGQVALRWAERAPEQVERIALIATTPCFVQRDTWPCAIAPRVLREFASALEVDAGRTLARFSLLQAKGDSRSKAVVAGLRRALASESTAEVEALRGGLDILLNADLRERAERIAQPVLVIHGENDSLIPIAAAEWLASTLPDGKLERVRDASHAPFISNPAVTATALREFFA